MYNFTIFLIIFINLSQVFNLEEDYYWREYTGTIPNDAIIAGQDINSKNLYIGQAYIHDQGLIVAEIIPGEKSVKAPSYGVKTVDSYIKILCGNQANFYWTPANRTDLHLLLIDKKPVIGGHEKGGVLYIGRLKLEGNLKIGKVMGYNPGNADIYISNKNQEKKIPSYEILLFNDNNVDVRIAEK